MRASHRDNAKAVIVEIARATGLNFARADRLTRAEAEQVIRWGQSSPEFMAAYSDRAHPGHEEAQSFSVWPFYFGHTHPQDEAGEPVEWDRVRTADDDAADEAAAEAADDPFKEWTAEQARERIEAAMKDEKYQEFRDAQGNRAHPDHELAKREIARLYEIAYPEQPAEPAPSVNPAGAAAPGGSGNRAAGSTPIPPSDQAAAQQQIDRLYGDAEFMRRYQSPDREVRTAATAEMSAAFGAAYPEAATDSRAGDGAAPAAGDGAV